MTLLDVYGSLYYAGARTLEARLPDPAGTTRPVVIVRLRGRTALGGTAFVVLERRVDVDRRVRVFVATEVVGDASALAYRQGEAWLARD